VIQVVAHLVNGIGYLVLALVAHLLEFAPVLGLAALRVDPIPNLVF